MLNRLLLCFFLLIAFVPIAEAAQSSSISDFLPPVTKPIIVKVGLYIDDIEKVDEIDEAVTLTATRILSWYDPRMKFKPKKFQATTKIYTGQAALDEINRIWDPYVRLLFVIGNRDIQSRVLEIQANGHITYRELFTANVKTALDARGFPFDSQKINLGMRSLTFSRKQVKLVADPKYEGIDSGAFSQEWQINKGFRSAISDVHIKYSDKTFSTYQFRFSILRNASRYVYELIIPLAIFVFLSWVVFWLPKVKPNDKIAMELTLLLTIVAFQWRISGDIPHTTYLTFMDFYIVSAFAFMCVLIGTLFIFHHLEAREPGRQFARVERICEIIFPVLYLITLFAVAGFYFL